MNRINRTNAHVPIMATLVAAWLTYQTLNLISTVWSFIQ